MMVVADRAIADWPVKYCMNMKVVHLKFEHIVRIENLNTPYSSHQYIELELQDAVLDAVGRRRHHHYCVVIWGGWEVDLHSIQKDGP